MATQSESLYWSYRLAKLEVVGEGRGVGHLAFAQYEEHLPQNLAALAQRIERDGLFRGVDPGRVWVQPKDVTYDAKRHAPVRDSSSLKSLTVRVLLEPSPDFAISEARWLQLFGVYLDASLDRNCLANRLLAVDSSGLASDGRSIFRSWVPSYRRFRQQPITVARGLLSVGIACKFTRIDIASYFDNIDAGFMLDPAFIQSIQSQHAHFPAELYVKCTQGLLDAFRQYWRSVEQVLKIANPRGIPIGSLAARVIANLALRNLDSHVQGQSHVHYYARYVDDVVLIEVEPNRGRGRGRSGLERSLPIASARPGASGIALDAAALRRPGSHFALQQSKVRQHDLKGQVGMAMLEEIARETDRLTSLRDHFLDPAPIVDEFDSGEPLSSAPLQREEDALALIKQQINLVAAKVSTAAAMLPAEEARPFSRRHFERRIPQLVRRWAELLDVIWSVMAAALSSHDFVTAHEIARQLQTQFAALKSRSSRTLKVAWGVHRVAPGRAMRQLRAWVDAQREQAVCASMPLQDGVGDSVTLFTNARLAGEAVDNARMLVLAGLRRHDRERDVASGAPALLRDADWRNDLADVFDTPSSIERCQRCQRFVEVCQDLGDLAYSSLSPVELLLYIEPPTYADVLLRWLRASEEISTIHVTVNALRGTNFDAPPMTLNEQTLHIDQDEEPSPVFRLALGHLTTDEAWWKASLVSPALTAARLERVWRVINMAIDEARRSARSQVPILLVLPELSLPQKWIRYVVGHLLAIGRTVPLGLVAGLEYSRDGNRVFNEVLAFFPRPSGAAAGWLWTKRRPSHHESIHLLDQHCIFASRHDKTRFTTIAGEYGRLIPLICSELLEVDSRAELLGRVETVLVTAWNQDTTSFEHVINASALDLHAFVAVANNGIFSDARTRGPYADPWLRDMCRLIARGANEIITADVPIGRLREYQDDPKAYDAKSKADKTEYPGWKPTPPSWNRRP